MVGLLRLFQLQLNRDDPDELKRYSFSVWSYKQGEMVSLMIHIGDRLGLYKSLDGAGPLSAAELAARTGLQERWLLEWLRGQAAARLLGCGRNTLTRRLRELGIE